MPDLRVEKLINKNLTSCVYSFVVVIRDAPPVTPPPLKIRAEGGFAHFGM